MYEEMLTPDFTQAAHLSDVYISDPLWESAFILKGSGRVRGEVRKEGEYGLCPVAR